jgi:hypothetical protein
MVARAKSRLRSAGYHHFLRRGPVAQLGARLTGSQEVRGSNPLGSTSVLSQDIVPGAGICAACYAVFDVTTIS